MFPTLISNDPMWELPWCMLLVLTVFMLLTKRDKFWDREWAGDDSVDVNTTYWCCVDWCWHCWCDWENILVYCESFDDACCLCWLCWRCWQRNPSSETRTELEMMVLMNVATCWCCVDWCWQCWCDWENILVNCESFDDMCCLCWLCWLCWIRNPGSETRT